MRFAAILIGVICVLPQSAAEVYKYVDDRGVVHYTDKPPEPGAKPAQLPPLQTYGNETDAAAAAAPPNRIDRRGPEAKPGTQSVAAFISIEISSPAPDQTFHTADVLQSLTASANVRPQLLHELGHRVVFYLDGQARPAPPGQTSVALPGLGRGSHTLSAAVVDQDGRVMAQSASHSFHLLPPTVARPARR